MSFQVFILRSAQKQLVKLDKVIYERVRDDIINLSEDPRPFGCKKLTARMENSCRRLSSDL